MLLLTEYLPETTELRLEESNGKKNLYIEGIFMQSAVKNRNGRIYPTAVLEQAVDKYNKEKVMTNRALGELNHPNSPVVDPERACHRIVQLEQRGNDFWGKALVVNTPMGNLLRGLIEGGTSIGVSSRGVGSLKTVGGGINEVKDDFMLGAIDTVYDPSAPSAFVNGIMEGVEFFMEDGVLTQRKVESIQNKIHETKAADLPRTMDAIFADVMKGFMNSEL